MASRWHSVFRQLFTSGIRKARLILSHFAVKCAIHPTTKKHTEENARKRDDNLSIVENVLSERLIHTKVSFEILTLEERKKYQTLNTNLNDFMLLVSE